MKVWDNQEQKASYGGRPLGKTIFCSWLLVAESNPQNCPASPPLSRFLSILANADLKHIHYLVDLNTGIRHSFGILNGREVIFELLCLNSLVILNRIGSILNSYLIYFWVYSSNGRR
jgi:hypothetical protein